MSSTETQPCNSLLRPRLVITDNEEFGIGFKADSNGIPRRSLWTAIVVAAVVLSDQNDLRLGDEAETLYQLLLLLLTGSRLILHLELLTGQEL